MNSSNTVLIKWKQYPFFLEGRQSELIVLRAIIYKNRSLPFCYKGWDFYPTHLFFMPRLRANREFWHGDKSHSITNHVRSCMSLLNTFDEVNMLVELICLFLLFRGDGIIAVTEPRRVAAISMSYRVATEMNLSSRWVHRQGLQRYL